MTCTSRHLFISTQPACAPIYFINTHRYSVVFHVPHFANPTQRWDQGQYKSIFESSMFSFETVRNNVIYQALLNLIMKDCTILRRTFFDIYFAFKIPLWLVSDNVPSVRLYLVQQATVLRNSENYWHLTTFCLVWHFSWYHYLVFSTRIYAER